MFRAPKEYWRFHETSDTFVLLAASKWIASLTQHLTVPPTFVTHDSLSLTEIEAYVRQSSVPTDGWEFLVVKEYPRKGSVVCPLPKPEREIDCDNLCFPDILHYVAQANFTNAWKEAFKQWQRDPDVRSGGKTPVGLKWDDVLMDVLTRAYECPIIFDGCDNVFPNVRTRPEGEVTYGKTSPALAIVVETTAVRVCHPLQRFTLRNALTFSPALFAESNAKQLFIVYQMVLAVRTLHAKGLTLGDLTLDDLAINSQFWVTVLPRLERNLLPVKVADPEPPGGGSEFASNIATFLRKAVRHAVSNEDLDAANSVFRHHLSTAVQLWVKGQLANFDYLILLNYLCGRNFSNPNYYPVFPWVVDFSSRESGWRDLSKSKFRLNKGDQQLDLTYESLSHHVRTETAFTDKLVQPPHHITDVLSEITYYVYKARQTSKEVLCKHVRNRWVPAEYPSSIQRLQEWTPDECIPDFYMNPDLFTSIHADLPDLELPAWCKSPADFIAWHRAALEDDRVSEKLHLWIDLTFGYKLSGKAAVSSKNVCLHLVDNHTQFRDCGIVQLFNQPHPLRAVDRKYCSKKPPNMDMFLSFHLQPDDEGRSRTSLQEESEPPVIALPKDFDAAAALNELECFNVFLAKCGAGGVEAAERTEAKVSKELATRRLVRDMQVVGCLALELFLPKKFVPLGQHASLAARFDMAVKILSHEAHTIPLCIRNTIGTLLPTDFRIDATDRYPTVSEAGLPPPSAGQLLIPQMSSLAFPEYFAVFHRVMKQLENVDMGVQEVSRTAAFNSEAKQVVAEFKVKLLASELLPVLDALPPEGVDLILPTIKKAFVDVDTAILASWYLFEPFAKVLGPKKSAEHLLEPLLHIYETHSQTSKHLKLYHRTFLLTLIIRFGMSTFLSYFITFLIEAVGGYKDYEDSVKTREGLERTWVPSMASPEPDLGSVSSQDDQPKSAIEDFAEGEVFAFDNVSLDEASTGGEAENPELMGLSDMDVYIPSYFDADPTTDTDEPRRNEGNISHVAAESVIWLAHRLGPVLTAKHLSRNLLRMLNLCYMRPEYLGFSPEPRSTADQKIRISARQIRGDIMAESVLECLSGIACLYGDQIILLQYLPYTWDLVSLCRRKMTPNLEGGLIGCLALIHHILPFLSDTILMNELEDNVITQVLFPVFQLVASPTASFANGWRPRLILVYRLLDVIYLIGLRIGEEMARSHLTPLCKTFFAAFDRMYDQLGRRRSEAGEMSEQVFKELGHILVPDVAYSGYVAFYHLMGRAHLESNLDNLDLIKRLCLIQQERAPSIQPITFANLRLAAMPGEASPSPLNFSGNKIDIATQDASGSGDSGKSRTGVNDLTTLIKKDIGDSSRHLKGNWLAYWEHEIGRGGAEFNLKQIKLQSFTGHTGGVKCLHVLDNENSFLSGSRDRTVKVWSLRSQGDGAHASNCQWTYAQHKKSVLGVTFLQGLRLAASCDSTIHIWDPFVGSAVHQLDPARTGHVTVMRSTPQPSPMIFAAAMDSALHMIDCRTGAIAVDLKVCIGSAGLIRSLNVNPDGQGLIVGHTSGYISCLDLRTGRLKHAWKAHEGEVLTLTSLSATDFLSTSLDQTVSVWSSQEGKLKCSLSGKQEPIHCVEVHQNEIITGSTANRIGVRHGTSAEATFSSSRLRSDVIRGNLTAMKLLRMNQLLLLGQDAGGIMLVC